MQTQQPLKVGRRHKKNIEINILLSTGDLIDGKRIVTAIDKTEMDTIKNDKYLAVNIGKNFECYVPYRTVDLINSVSSLTLADIVCPHCKNTILMSIKTIRDEEQGICPICSRNLYDYKDKAVKAFNY